MLRAGAAPFAPRTTAWPTCSEKLGDASDAALDVAHMEPWPVCQRGKVADDAGVPCSPLCSTAMPSPAFGATGAPPYWNMAMVSPDLNPTAAPNFLLPEADTETFCSAGTALVDDAGPMWLSSEEADDDKFKLHEGADRDDFKLVGLEDFEQTLASFFHAEGNCWLRSQHRRRAEPACIHLGARGLRRVGRTNDAAVAFARAWLANDQ